MADTIGKALSKLMTGKVATEGAGTGGRVVASHVLRSAPPALSKSSGALLAGAADAPKLDMAGVTALKKALEEAGNQRAAMALAREQGLSPILPVRDTALGKEIASIVRLTPNDPLPQFAERYPAGGPPVLKPKDEGGFYLSKGSSLEGALVKRRRDEAQKIIKAGNYDRAFDPAQRFDVDPTKYDPMQSTLSLKMTKPDARVRQEANVHPDVAARLDAAYGHGQTLRGRGFGPQDWYMMGQYEKAYMDEFGPVLGRAHFVRDFPEAMAATTGGADPKSNFLMGSFGNFEREQGRMAPTGGWDMPYPIGGRFAGGNMEQYNRIINEGAGLDMFNPKRYDFKHNFLGNRGAATIDEQMMGLIAPDMKGSPTLAGYGIFEQPVHDAAARAGTDPRGFQDVTWAGAKDMKKPGSYIPQPMIEHPNEAIARSAHVTGLPEDEVMRRILRRNMPVYGVTGTVGLGAAMESMYGGDRQPQQQQVY